jgi:hypothetical protein
MESARPVLVILAARHSRPGRRTRSRHAYDLMKSGTHRVEKLKAEPCSTLFIPTSGFTVFRFSFIFEANWLHGLRSSALARR